MRTAFSLSAALTIGLVPALAAQEFDLSRAALHDSTVFEPFLVTETIPLSRAKADGRVDGDLRILVTETANGPLALITAQMAYHHLAQGQEAGEPWLVSF